MIKIINKARNKNKICLFSCKIKLYFTREHHLLYAFIFERVALLKKSAENYTDTNKYPLHFRYWFIHFKYEIDFGNSTGM